MLLAHLPLFPFLFAASALTDACSAPPQPPQLSDITSNAALIGRVIYTGDVYSELQCIDTCLRCPRCKAYNMEMSGLNLRCTILASREKRVARVGSFYRVFDREKIEKFLFQYDNCQVSVQPKASSQPTTSVSQTGFEN